MICEKMNDSPNRPDWPPKTAERRPVSRLEVHHPKPSTLRFSPTAWAKLLYLRDAGDSEVGGFGISAAEDLLYIEDVQLLRQDCDLASVVFDDPAVADFFDRQVDAGHKMSQVGRVWVHTHLGDCPGPSSTDEETFARVFGRTDWAVMFILARGGQTYARLEFHVGPGGSLLLPVEVDYRRPFQGSDEAAWREQYLANVHVEPWPPATEPGLYREPIPEDLGFPAEQDDWLDLWDDLLEEDLIHARLQQQRGMVDDNHFRT